MKNKKNIAAWVRAQLSDPDTAAAVEAEALNSNIAEQIYNARNALGITQEVLANRIGTKQPVIARLEAADYDGHSLSMLKRIADSLGLGLRVEFVPLLADQLETQESYFAPPPERFEWVSPAFQWNPEISPPEITFVPAQAA